MNYNISIKDKKEETLFFSAIRSYNIELVKYLDNKYKGWIYYPNKRQGNFLYKVREDGTENTQLTDYSIFSNHFTVKDGYLYFHTDSFNTSKIKL